MCCKYNYYILKKLYILWCFVSTKIIISPKGLGFYI